MAPDGRIGVELRLADELCRDDDGILLVEDVVCFMVDLAVCAENGEIELSFARKVRPVVSFVFVPFCEVKLACGGD